MDEITNEVTYYYVTRCEDCGNTMLSPDTTDVEISVDSAHYDGDCEDTCHFTEFEELAEPQTREVVY